jgi:hypothetical protein
VLASPSYVVYTDFEVNPDYMGDDGGEPPVRHVVRFGNDISYRIKARVPMAVRGKIPPILGRKNPTSLVTLSRVLGVGGIPAVNKRPAATAAKES